MRANGTGIGIWENSPLDRYLKRAEQEREERIAAEIAEARAQLDAEREGYHRLAAGLRERAVDDDGATMALGNLVAAVDELRAEVADKVADRPATTRKVIVRDKFTGLIARVDEYDAAGELRKRVKVRRDEQGMIAETDEEVF